MRSRYELQHRVTRSSWHRGLTIYGTGNEKEFGTRSFGDSYSIKATDIAKHTSYVRAVSGQLGFIISPLFQEFFLSVWDLIDSHDRTQGVVTMKNHLRIAFQIVFFTGLLTASALSGAQDSSAQQPGSEQPG